MRDFYFNLSFLFILCLLYQLPYTLVKTLINNFNNIVNLCVYHHVFWASFLFNYFIVSVLVFLCLCDTTMGNLYSLSNKFLYINTQYDILLSLGFPQYYRKNCNTEKYFRIISNIFSDGAKKASSNNQISLCIISFLLWLNIQKKIWQALLKKMGSKFYMLSLYFIYSLHKHAYLILYYILNNKNIT